MPSLNNIARRPLFPLELAVGGPPPPPGVCDTALMVSHIGLGFNLQPELYESLHVLSAAKYLEFVRNSTAAPNTKATRPAHFDAQHAAYMLITKAAYGPIVEIIMCLTLDDYTLRDMVSEIFVGDKCTDLAEYVQHKLMSEKTVMSAQHARDIATNVEGDVSTHTTTVTSGFAPVIVQLSSSSLLGIRRPITNHGQKGLNFGHFVYLQAPLEPSDVDLPLPTVGVESPCNNRLLSTHHACHAANCVAAGQTSSKRALFIKVMRRLDEITGVKRVPNNRWDATLVYPRPCGMGDAMVRSKTVGLIYMLTYNNSSGVFSLQSLMWHIIRMGAASPSGEFPKTNSTPITMVFIVLLYELIALTTVCTADGTESPSEMATLWNELKEEWVKEVHRVRQKQYKHFMVWYMLEQFSATGEIYLKFQPLKVSPLVIESHENVVVDHTDRVSLGSLVGAITSDEEVTGPFPNTETWSWANRLCATCSLHASLGKVIGLTALQTVYIDVLNEKLSRLVHTVIINMTHSTSVRRTITDVVALIQRSFAVPLSSPVWQLLVSVTRSESGPAVHPDVITHPLMEVIYYTLIRVAPIPAELMDSFYYEPIVEDGGLEELPVFSIPGTLCIVVARTLCPLMQAIGFRATDLSISLRTATVSETPFESVFLSVRTGLNHAVPLSTLNQTELTENLIMQACSSPGAERILVAGFNMGVALMPRTETPLSPPLDQIWNMYVPCRLTPKPAISSSSPLLLCTISSAGLVFIDIRPNQFIFIIAILIPLYEDGQCVFAPRFLSFASSDKQVTVWHSDRLDGCKLFSQFASVSGTLHARRQDLRRYLISEVFASARVGTGKKSDGQLSLPNSDNGPDLWTKVTTEKTKVLFGLLVRDTPNIVAFFESLLTEDDKEGLYEGIMRYADPLRRVWGIETDAVGEQWISLWQYARRKTDELRRTAAEKNVAVAAIGRIQNRLTTLADQRLRLSESSLALLLHTDGNDTQELLESKVQARSIISEQTELTGAGSAMATLDKSHKRKSTVVSPEIEGIRSTKQCFEPAALEAFDF